MVKYRMEIQDQMNYFALKLGNQMLHCVLFFEEHLDYIVLKEAIRRSIEIEKILGCHLIKRGNLAYWENCEDLKQSVCCEIMETTDTQKELEHFLVKEIDLENDPLVQVKIFRDSKDCLCIKISHAISDASGLKKYVSLLAQLYTELVYGSETHDKSLSTSDRSQNQIFQDLDPSVITALSDKGKQFFRNIQPNWSFPSKGYQRNKLSFAIERISSHIYCAIKDMAKAKKATLNDILLAAFCCALKKEEGFPSDRPMIVQVPVDLRRYLADKKALPICNLSGADYLNIMIGNENFENVLDKVHQSMQSVKADYPRLTSAFALESMGKLDFEQAMSIAQDSMGKSIQYNVSIPLLTNMGIIPDHCKKFGDSIADDGYLVSPLMYSPGFMLGVSSFGDKMTLTVGYSEESIEMDHIQKFMRRIIAELEQACFHRVS